MMRTLIILVLLALPVNAVEPDEMLADPVLEARAQALDEAIRCVRCQSESIASSNADWARTARVIVRERLVAGDTDAQVIQYFVDRYGDYVRMQPRFGGSEAILWLTAPLFLLGGAVIAYLTIRRRPKDADPLSRAERSRLEELTRE